MKRLLPLVLLCLLLTGCGRGNPLPDGMEEESGQLCCGGQSVQLGAKECQLMRLLMAAGGAVVPRETLYLKGWGYDGEAEGNVVEVYMSFLRRKLTHLRSRVQIEAVRRMGYHLREAEA